jgi:phage terminase small subunit
MPPLSNPRHEAFVRALFENKSADESYELAGYKPHRQNAHRLMTKDDVRARLSELQQEAQRKSEVSVASLLAELEHARQRADSLDQLSAVVKSISEKAKISGLLVSRVEATITVEDKLYETAANADDLALLLARNFAGDTVLSQTELKQLATILQQATQQASEYVASCRARPINGAISQRAIEQRRLTNGKANGR